MGLAIGGERQGKRLFRRGLADRAGDADELGGRSCARRAGEIRERRQHIRDHQERRLGGETPKLVGGNDRERRPGGERRRHEVMAVAIIAGYRKEGIAGPETAAVDRHSVCGSR